MPSRYLAATDRSSGHNAIQLVLIPLGCVLAAALVRQGLQPWLGPLFPYFTFYLAVVAACWFGGAKAGMLCFFVGYFAATYLFANPHGHFVPQNFPSLVATAFYTITAMVTIALFAHRRQTETTLTRQSALTRAITDNASAALFIMDDRSRCVFMNPAAEELTGYTLKEVRGKILHDVIHHTRPDGTPFPLEECAIDRAFPQNNRERGEEVFVHKDGHFYSVAYTASPVREQDAAGEIRGTVIEARDITAEKQAQQAERDHLAEIEMLNRRLRRAMRETHHRVKNNLQVISAMLDLQILEKRETVPVSELQRLNRHIHALAIIHDVLTREAKQDADLETMSAREGIGRVVDMLRSMSPERQFTTNLEDVEIPLRYGPSLAILVNELISNAVKHGSRTVEVNLSRKNGHVRLEVCDDGPGFPSDFRHDKDANTGLELVQNVAGWDMGGETRYENRPEGGARVVVTFPAAVAAHRGNDQPGT